MPSNAMSRPIADPCRPRQLCHPQAPQKLASRRRGAGLSGASSALDPYRRSRCARRCVAATIKLPYLDRNVWPVAALQSALRLLRGEADASCRFPCKNRRAGGAVPHGEGPLGAIPPARLIRLARQVEVREGAVHVRLDDLARGADVGFVELVVGGDAEQR